MVTKNDLNMEQNILWKSYSILVWIIYLPLGLAFCAISIFQIAALVVTIIGIPSAIVIAKSIGTYFNPVNKVCVPVAVRDEMKRREANGYFNR